jgi:hypothetical protein
MPRNYILAGPRESKRWAKLDRKSDVNVDVQRPVLSEEAFRTRVIVLAAPRMQIVGKPWTYSSCQFKRVHQAVPQRSLNLESSGAS